ncbi:MAG: lipoyl(octanoyl) transferase LipB [Candidatus Latescibacterota bacterium]
MVWLDLGRMEYGPAWDLQRDIQKRLIDAKRADPPLPQLPPNVLLTVEHPPVFTLGKSGDAAHLLASANQLEGIGATFVETDRGGDITYHGPGQLVGYPILDLDRFFTDIGRYLRTLESAIIRACESYGLSAGRVPGRTGVWIDAGKPNERKICAMGIRCSRWVTMHGFALNMNTELDFYDRIIPCGISDRGVTSLARELGEPVDEDDCRKRVVEAFGEAFEAPVNSAASVEELLT